MLLRVVACSFLLLSDLHGWCHKSLFIHLPGDGHLSCLQFGVIMNKTAIPICIQVWV